MKTPIHVFEQEKLDGVGEAVASQASIAYCSPANITNSAIYKPNIKELTALASANKDQIDLFYLDTVLVSTGWNKNDDVFLPDQVWAARHTPEDKQFNYMHDEKDIIGHITGSYVLDHEGKIVADDNEEIPKTFDIITEAVIYKHWRDSTLKERMEKIIAEIGQNLWYVSMECLFSGFNYALISEKGENLILERNEASAHLTKYLRAYGGDGQHEGYKIGRALSGISYSGKGLVQRPANPRSVILSSKAEFDLSEQDFTDNIFTKGDNQMSESLEKQIAELKADLAAAKAENDLIRKEVEEAKAKEINTLIADKESALSELTNKLEASLKEVEELKASLETKATELAEVNKVVETIKAEQKASERVSKLVEAGFEPEDAKESVTLYDALSDEAFEGVVAKFDFFKKKKDDKDGKDKKDEKETKAKKDAEAPKKDAEAKKEKEEATDATFDGAKAEEVITDIETDKLSESRASVADWISKNIMGVE